MNAVLEGEDLGLGRGLPAQRAFILLAEGSLNATQMRIQSQYQVWWKTWPHLVAMRFYVRSDRQIAQVGIW